MREDLEYKINNLKIKTAQTLENTNLYKYKGVVSKLLGLTVDVKLPGLKIGDLCYIQTYTGEKKAAEVQAFKGDVAQLLLLYDSEGIGQGSLVETTGGPILLPVGDFLLGRLINPLGEPMDSKPLDITGAKYMNINGTIPDAFHRPIITQQMSTGVRVIDGLLTMGTGQRMGLFAGSGVGKSTLMGMIARNVKTDINVIALVGERGREVLEFVQKDLGEEGMKRSILVAATSDQPAMLRMKCPSVATAIAEYFRDQGLNVLLMMDSLTRFAMAQREIGLAVGEPPVARGYTPSIYAELPKLLERSGNFEKGSITAVYTVLVEGDDTNEPIADTVRGILDGHIVLSRKLANANHFPAIDVSASISRLMTEIVTPEHRRLSGKLRDILSIYEKNEDLIAIGAYKSGTNPKLDYAISKIDSINNFLKQGINETFSYDESLKQLERILK